MSLLLQQARAHLVCGTACSATDQHEWCFELTCDCITITQSQNLRLTFFLFIRCIGCLLFVLIFLGSLFSCDGRSHALEPGRDVMLAPFEAEARAVWEDRKENRAYPSNRALGRVGRLAVAGSPPRQGRGSIPGSLGRISKSRNLPRLGEHRQELSAVDLSWRWPCLTGGCKAARPPSGTPRGCQALWPCSGGRPMAARGTASMNHD